MQVCAAAVIVSWLDAPAPVILYHASDHFTLSWDAVPDAVSYEFTTDGGSSWLAILSGIDVTTDSREQALVEKTWYEVRVRSVGIGGNTCDVSPPSEIVEVYTNAILPAILMLLTPYPTEDTAIWLLRAYIVDSGDALVTIEFHYGLTVGYGSVAAAVGEYLSKSIAVKYVRLLPNRTYHFMARGTNLGGATETEDALLQTSGDIFWRVYEASG
jgi:hypothetical protein